MPDYRTPGVYIEEFEIGAKPIEGVPTSVAAFLGETERGPVKPTLVTSWLDYQRGFGGIFAEDKYLPYTVFGFFENGGRECFVTRIAGKNAARATKTFGGLRLDAVGPGSWGNRLWAKVELGSTLDGAGNPKGFNLRLFYWETAIAQPFDPTLPLNRDLRPLPQAQEVFEDLDLDAKSPNYAVRRLSDGNSSLVEASVVDPAQPPQPEDALLENGGDGDPITSAQFDVEQEGDRRGLAALTEPEYENVAIVYAPFTTLEYDAIAKRVIAHCEKQMYRFAIVDANKGVANTTALNPRGSVQDTKYGAFYYPWIQIVDPESGKRVWAPPGGHVAGIYARSDRERGVWKAPANEIVRGALRVEYQVTDDKQAFLNPAGVNVIRSFRNRGIRVWGARTISSDPLWKYINVRRLFIFLEASIFRNTQWVVFEPNNEQLWARVRQTIVQFLRGVWRQGALMGLKEDEAFFVKADRTTMTQDDIDNGRLVVVIGVAPVKPAEFVIFRIAQFTAESRPQ